MKRTTLVLMALCLGSVSARAERRQVTQQITLSDSESATANFQSEDATGCITTFVFLSAAKGKVKSSSDDRTFSSGATVVVSQWNHCQDIVFTDFFCQAPSANFTVDRSLATASLRDTFIGCADLVNGTPIDVSVNMTWSATGRLTNDVSNSRTRVPGMITVSHFVGKQRPASATGTIITGSSGNLTPTSSLEAEIQSSQMGSIIVQIN